MIADEEKEPAEADLWGSSTPFKAVSPTSARSGLRGLPQSHIIRNSPRNDSIPTRVSKHLDNERFPQRDLIDPTLRLSTASTAAGNEGSLTKDSAVEDIEKVSFSKRHHNELRRKISSLSLRDLDSVVAVT